SCGRGGAGHYSLALVRPTSAIANPMTPTAAPAAARNNHRVDAWPSVPMTLTTSATKKPATTTPPRSAQRRRRADGSHVTNGGATTASAVSSRTISRPQPNTTGAAMLAPRSTWDTTNMAPTTATPVPHAPNRRADAPAAITTTALAPSSPISPPYRCG